ncbi:MAG: hypothetical protein A3D31_02455 [Candidatus Fluviicola riflensis]|nr:MAG: hypothetical protein CHH17_12585 [Candidatus Fluviicola riflensis]OGS78853.1 MAG: hypothetical protein A3D31_02455 [Candidatus Fluviicola riflensis]OGS85875.1 MAG: hypothetical protein A3E30_09940 [Fluviicola sp. RIFCSPHIGHO2_12_FULL_43_24]OGS86284.1 MAG: hypothetical protein A2724_01910 [Fluviicola sp. RIFCSPHIGHO2_01_FULL_43_53]
MLISLIITAAIGRAFFSLAHDHYRHAWGFAILGGGVFFGSQVIFGIILGVILALTENLEVLSTTSGVLMINLIGYGVSLAACGVLYFLLKRSWTKNPRNQKESSDLIDQ